MTNRKFRAFWVEESGEKKFTRRVVERELSSLPEGEVLVRVRYSSVNYKDVLSAQGNRGVTRAYPHTPGIDAAGDVAHSDSPDFTPGDPVIVTSYDLGMNTPGGWGQYIRVPAAWVVPLPPGLGLREAMILGTAGFTAAQSVRALVRHGLGPQDGPVLVTGGSGGVGSLAIAILHRLGWRIWAVNGRQDHGDFLRGLGAEQVLEIDQVADASQRPLLKARWLGAIDTVGGEMLASVIRATDQYGVVTCCGNVAGPQLPVTVFPFILRGVTLAGINSQSLPMAPRREIWANLAGGWRPLGLDEMAEEVGLDELDQALERLPSGRRQGRLVVNLGD